MSHGRTPKLEREIRAALDELNVPYRVEIGTKHRKFFVGSELLTVIPHGGESRLDPKFLAKVISKWKRRNVDSVRPVRRV